MLRRAPVFLRLEAPCLGDRRGAPDPGAMLDAATLRRYRDEGYIVLRGILNPDLLRSLRSQVVAWEEANRAPDARNLRYRFKNAAPNGALTLDAIDPVLDLFPALGPLAVDGDLPRCVSALFDEPACLFKDKLVRKMPGVAGYALHQDYIRWPDFPTSFTTALVPLDEASRDNGCIEVFPQLHRRGALSPQDGDYHDLPETSVAGTVPVALELKPGDVAIFGAFVPHRSGANDSAQPRRQLYLSYNRRGELGDYRTRHYQRFHAWLLQRYSEFGANGFYFS